MTGTGINMGDVKRSNVSLLLKLLYFDGPQSRKILSQKTSLTPGTVTMLTTELIEKGIVVETTMPERRARAGRNEQYIDLNYGGLYVAGVKLGTDLCHIGLYRLGFDLVDSIRLPFDPGVSGETLFERICDKVALLMVGRGLTTKELLAIGVTMRGIIDPEQGVSINSFGIIEENFPVRCAMERRLGIPVMVDNNVRSMLSAENAMLHRPHGASRLFVKYGPGVGGAFSIGETAYNGANFRAIEVGHIVLDPAGPPCHCGRRGCLETMVSYDALCQAAGALLSAEATPVLFRLTEGGRLPITIHSVMSTLCEEDQPIRDMVRQKLRLFVVQLDQCVTMFDPEAVSICSELFEFETFKQLLLDEIRACAPSLLPMLVLNSQQDMIEEMGAPSLAVFGFLSGTAVRQTT